MIGTVIVIACIIIGFLLGGFIGEVLMGMGYLGYLGWIAKGIHWGWAAFAGILCILVGLALWAIMSQHDAFK